MIISILLNLITLLLLLLFVVVVDLCPVEFLVFPDQQFPLVYDHLLPIVFHFDLHTLCQ